MTLRKGIYVNTPQGERHHGDVIGDYFVRSVEWKKDRMKIFDAWSIHPDALDEIEKMGIKKLKYILPDRMFIISVKKARKKGFTREFAGGITHYIPVKHWEVEQIPQSWKCLRCNNNNVALARQCEICFLERPKQELKELEK